jgi:hypothetical protein
MFVVHYTLPNQRKMKKNTMPPIKSSHFFQSNGFSSKIRIHYAFIAQKVQKKHIFLTGFQSNL